MWDAGNLQAACGPCNFGDGAHVKAANQRSTRKRISELESIVQVQEARIDELAQALARYQNSPTTERAPNRAKPDGDSPRVNHRAAPAIR